MGFRLAGTVIVRTRDLLQVIRRDALHQVTLDPSGMLVRWWVSPESHFVTEFIITHDKNTVMVDKESSQDVARQFFADVCGSNGPDVLWERIDRDGKPSVWYRNGQEVR